MKKQTKGERAFNRWFKYLQKVAKANGLVFIVSLDCGKKFSGRWGWGE